MAGDLFNVVPLWRCGVVARHQDKDDKQSQRGQLRGRLWFTSGLVPAERSPAFITDQWKQQELLHTHAGRRRIVGTATHPAAPHSVNQNPTKHMTLNGKIVTIQHCFIFYLFIYLFFVQLFIYLFLWRMVVAAAAAAAGVGRDEGVSIM